MLKPALRFKNELLSKFAAVLYTEDYFYYYGYEDGSILPKIDEQEYVYQYAIVDKNNEVLGYLSYRIEPTTNCAHNFGIYSFKKGSYIVGKDIKTKLLELVEQCDRVEWCAVSGNPAIRSYDRFLKSINGRVRNKVELHNCIKDKHGQLHNSIIYEVYR